MKPSLPGPTFAAFGAKKLWNAVENLIIGPKQTTFGG